MSDNPFLSNSSKKNPFLSGTIEPTENILQRAIKKSSQVRDANPLFSQFAAGGPTGVAGGVDPESIQGALPGMGQFAGSVGGTIGGAAMAGRPFTGQIVGGTLGRMAGEAINQSVKGVTGKGFDITEI